MSAPAHDPTVRHVQVEVSGRVTTCMHCWAVGGRYGAMPLADLRLTLDRIASYCDAEGLGFTAYPMHEVLAHPQAPEVLRLFAPRLGGPYDPMVTPGAAFGAEPVTREELYFPGARMASAALATRYGDAGGRNVYMNLRSLRYRWLDQHHA